LSTGHRRLRLGFAGTPKFAVPALDALEAAYGICAVFTQPDRPAGRGRSLHASPVKSRAAELRLPVHQPLSFKSPEALQILRDLSLDALVVVAYGLILPRAALESPRLGCINIHASLLPRWRGAAPIHRAIMAGDHESGVMAMKMEEGLDTGPIAMAERVPIGSGMTTGELHDMLAPRGAKLMLVALSALERGTLQLTPQPDDGATYAAKIDKGETRIDWNKPWSKVHNHCRGLSPFPGAWFELPGAGRIKVLRTTKGDGKGAPGTVLDDKLTIACGDGAVRLVELQRAGKQPMQADEFLRGTPVARGTVLS
jgi:methionyl-tRNA formyltransferase